MYDCKDSDYLSNTISLSDQCIVSTHFTLCLDTEGKAYKAKVKPFLGAKALLMAVGFSPNESGDSLVLKEDAGTAYRLDVRYGAMCARLLRSCEPAATLASSVPNHASSGFVAEAVDGRAGVAAHGLRP